MIWQWFSAMVVCECGPWFSVVPNKSETGCGGSEFFKVSSELLPCPDRGVRVSDCCTQVGPHNTLGVCKTRMKAPRRLSWESVRRCLS